MADGGTSGSKGKSMEALVRVALEQPQGMSNKEFFGLWSQEARAAGLS